MAKSEITVSPVAPHLHPGTVLTATAQVEPDDEGPFSFTVENGNEERVIPSTKVGHEVSGSFTLLRHGEHKVSLSSDGKSIGKTKIDTTAE